MVHPAAQSHLSSDWCRWQLVELDPYRLELCGARRATRLRCVHQAGCPSAGWRLRRGADRRGRCETVAQLPLSRCRPPTYWRMSAINVQYRGGFYNEKDRLHRGSHDADGWFAGERPVGAEWKHELTRIRAVTTDGRAGPRWVRRRIWLGRRVSDTAEGWLR